MTLPRQNIGEALAPPRRVDPHPEHLCDVRIAADVGADPEARQVFKRDR